MVRYTAEEIAEYRDKKAAEKRKAADAQAESDAEATKAARVAARERLEERVKSRFLDAGGTAGEYLRLKRQLVEAALMAEATQPAEPDVAPEKPVADAPLTRRQYRDMGDGSGGR